MMPGASKSPEAAEKVNPKPETLNPNGFGIVGLGFLVGASGLVGVGFRIYGLVYGVQGKGAAVAAVSSCYTSKLPGFYWALEYHTLILFLKGTKMK